MVLRIIIVQFQLEHILIKAALGRKDDRVVLCLRKKRGKQNKSYEPQTSFHNISAKIHNKMQHKMKKRFCLFIKNIKLLKIKLLQTYIPYHRLSSSPKKERQRPHSPRLSTNIRPNVRFFLLPRAAAWVRFCECRVRR